MGVGHHILMISLPNITITVIIKLQHLACSQLIRTSQTLKSTQQYKHFTCMITIVIVRYFIFSSDTHAILQLCAL